MPRACPFDLALHLAGNCLCDSPSSNTREWDLVEPLFSERKRLLSLALPLVLYLSRPSDEFCDVSWGQMIACSMLAQGN